MKISYSDTGFEQDNTPQLLVEGTQVEIENLISKIEPSIRNNKQGELAKIHSDGVSELLLINKAGDNQLIKKVGENKYKMSLDVSLWNKVLDMLKPLLKNKGYQFVEITDSPVVEDVGLVFRASEAMD